MTVVAHAEACLIVAQQAASRRHSHLLPAHGSSLAVDDIHVKQPSQWMVVFYGTGHPFGHGGRGAHQGIGFKPRHQVALCHQVNVEWSKMRYHFLFGCFRHDKRLAITLDIAGHDHREAHQRASVILLQ